MLEQAKVIVTNTTPLIALTAATGLVGAECFLMTGNQDKFDHTEWRRTGLPVMSIEQIAAAANQFSGQLSQS